MKKILTLICTLLCANVLFAQYVGTTFWIGDIQYEITSSLMNKVVVNAADTTITTANIPATVTYQGGTYSVTSIGDHAFDYCRSLTSVTIPNSVTSIGDYAFLGCSSLTSVTIPNSVTSIGYEAFRDCRSLTSVTIPNSVNSIEGSTFLGCDSLTSITIPNSVTSIGNFAFAHCSSLTSVTIPNSVISIGNNAFYNCSSLTSVTIPNSVTSLNGVISIGDDAFRGCSSLTSVTCLGSNSPSLGSNVFSSTPNNKTLTIPCGCESAYNNWQNATTWASIYCIVTIGSPFTIGDLTYEITSETKVKVQDCTQSATSVVIPETATYQGTTYSVTSIGYRAFYNCSSLTSVTIPNGVTSIGNNAFYNCSSLTSVTIPNSVIAIGNYAFNNCSSLTSVTCLRSNRPSLGYNVFYGTPNNKTLTIPCGANYSYWQNATTWASIDCIVPIGSLFTIGDLTYEVTEVISETEVKVQACTQSATSVVIPETVTYQGRTYSVTSIGDYAFYNCSSLTSMTIEINNIPNLSNIGLNSTLQNLTLGENVTSIASGAFNNYSFLQNVTCLATTPPTLADNTVFPYPNIATLTVPCGTLEAYSAPTSFWNMFFSGRISENGYDVVATANDNAFGSVAVENDCSTSTLTATANDCYQFVSWNDGNTDNPRIVSISSLSSDTAFTAIFEDLNIELSATICEGSVYNENNFNVSEAGVYTQNLTSVNGCDSIVTLTLNVNPIYNTELSSTICQGQTYAENGFNVNEAGVYTQTLTSVNGCDSIVTLTVSVNPVFDTIIYATINSWETYMEHGFNESEEGTYVQNLQTANGCDSTITLNLTIDVSLMDVEDTELSFYPNPTDSKITFSSTIEKIEVIDLSGKTLQTYENANEINIEALPAGVYHLRMTIGDKTTTRKIIKE